MAKKSKDFTPSNYSPKPSGVETINKVSAHLQGIDDALGADKTGSVVFVSSNGAYPITTGPKGYVQVPYSGTITGWELVADVSGSLSLDVWKGTFAEYPLSVANSIIGGNYITLTSAQKNSGTVTGWAGVTIAAGDYFRVNVNSASLVKKFTLVLKTTKTS